jgi:hypothetical protein
MNVRYLETHMWRDIEESLGRSNPCQAEVFITIAALQCGELSMGRQLPIAWCVH